MPTVPVDPAGATSNNPVDPDVAQVLQFTKRMLDEREKEWLTPEERQRIKDAVTDEEKDTLRRTLIEEARKKKRAHFQQAAFDGLTTVKPRFSPRTFFAFYCVVGTAVMWFVVSAVLIIFFAFFSWLIGLGAISLPAGIIYLLSVVIGLIASLMLTNYIVHETIDSWYPEIPKGHVGYLTYYETPVERWWVDQEKSWWSQWMDRVKDERDRARKALEEQAAEAPLGADVSPPPEDPDKLVNRPFLTISQSRTPAVYPYALVTEEIKKFEGEILPMKITIRGEPSDAQLDARDENNNGTDGKKKEDLTQLRVALFSCTVNLRTNFKDFRNLILLKFTQGGINAVADRVKSRIAAEMKSYAASDRGFINLLEALAFSADINDFLVPLLYKELAETGTDFETLAGNIQPTEDMQRKIEENQDEKVEGAQEVANAATIRKAWAVANGASPTADEAGIDAWYEKHPSKVMPPRMMALALMEKNGALPQGSTVQVVESENPIPAFLEAIRSFMQADRTGGNT